ncbi:MAG: HEXXH motif-containing putative peptide modification protein [Cytophagales bacterium]|nr:HEXXH motif-containing putative peptide modification protein [Cytophagales bacterium]
METNHVLTAEVSWKALAVPQPGGEDTKHLLAMAREQALRKEPAPESGEPALFDGRVALREFEWSEAFLKQFKHSSLDHPNLKKAEQLIACWPEIYEQCGQILNAINPMRIKGVNNDTDHPGSNSHQPKNTFGAAWATVHNPLLLAQAIVHEMAHNKLLALGQGFEEASPLFENSPDDLFDSPIRLDIPRPVAALFHGIYAFAHVLALDLRMYKREKSREREIRSLVRINALRVRKGMDILEKCAKWTTEGQEFFFSFRIWVAGLLREAFVLLKSAAASVASRSRLVLVGPESEAKSMLAVRLAESDSRGVLELEKMCWDVWEQSKVVQKKQLEIMGSKEVVSAFKQSSKFSSGQWISNWLKKGFFSREEYEFMKLQLANYVLKNSSDEILVFGSDHSLFKLHRFLMRLMELLSEHRAKVIYVRPVEPLEEAVSFLQTASPLPAKSLRDMLANASNRTISEYTFDASAPFEEEWEKLGDYLEV